ncbi:hypothetical protein LTS17_009796 [Exophiala oligosperma]
MYRRVKLQSWFAKPTQYWIIGSEFGNRHHHSHQPLASGAISAVTRAVPSTPASSSTLLPVTTPHSSPSIASSDNVERHFQARTSISHQRHKDRYRQVGEPNHVSELTPWLRKSQFHAHLANLDAESIAASHAIPQQDAEDFFSLSELILSAERVLQRAYELVPPLLNVDAQVLNSFQAGTTS